MGISVKPMGKIGFLGTTLILFFFTATLNAAPLTFNIDGVISDSTGTPLEAANVPFQIDVTNPDGTCVLYRESVTVDMTGAKGYFSVAVGKGTNSIAGGYTLDKVFANNGNAIVGSGAACPYTPASTSETRKIQVSFYDGGTWQAFTSQEIQSVPFAVEALQSTKVGVYDQNHILRIDPAIASPANSDLNATQLAEFFRLVNNPSTAYVSSGVSSITAASTVGNPLSIGGTASAPTVDIPVATSTTNGYLKSADWTTFNNKQAALGYTPLNSANNLSDLTNATTARTNLGLGTISTMSPSGTADSSTYLRGDGSWATVATGSGTVTNIATGTGLTGGPITATGTISADYTTTGVASKLLMLDASGIATVAGLNVKTGTGTVTLKTAGAFTNYILTLPSAAPAAGQSLQSDASGNLSWFSGPTSVWTNGGNNFGATSTFGNMGSYNLNVITNSTTRMTVTAGGKIGIGTATPQSSLEIRDSTQIPQFTVVNDGSTAASQSIINLQTYATATASAFGAANDFTKGWQIFANGNSYASGSGGANYLGITYFGGNSSGWKDLMYMSPMGRVGIGVAPTTANLEVEQPTAGLTAIQAQSSGIATYWKVMNPANGISAGWNTTSAVEFVAKDTTTGRSINAAGTINTGGADFAEWVDWDSGPKPQMGSVINYKGSYVVVSSPFTAAFVGNDNKDPELAILVAFAGQLPVLVHGVVNEGDLIIAREDGTARAVSKAMATLADAQKVVGTAWESSSNPDLKRVNVAIGIGVGASGLRDIASQTTRLEKENAAKSKEIAELKARLEKLERILNAK